MGTRMRMLTVGLALAAAAMAGCSSTTAGSSGAMQDDATASASAGAACADGGVCQIGDEGPGGGAVFYAASTPFSAPGTACGDTCLYLEAQPSPIGPFQWCKGPATAKGYSIDAQGTAIGTGYLNTQAMLGTYNDPPAQICTSGAANAAVASWGGYSDWYLPSYDELTSLLGYGPQVQYFYWSSTQSSPNQPLSFPPPPEGIKGSPSESEYGYVQPIRAFS